jgi:hypothetical protein
MARIPDLRAIRLTPASDRLVDLVQAQEIRLMSVRLDDHWNVERRRFGSRRKYLGTSDLVQASKHDLKVYYLHLISKELEVI